MRTVERHVFSLITFITLIALCLPLGPSALPAYAQTYRWTTPNGTAAFSDRLPRTGTLSNLTRMREVPGALTIFYDDSDMLEPAVVSEREAAPDAGRIGTDEDRPAAVDDHISSEFSLVGAEGIGINLSHAVLTGAYLAQANLYGATLNDANLQEAYMLGVNLPTAALVATSLQRANMTEANLWQADLRRADLQGAQMVATNLRWSDLSQATLRGAHLVDANLDGATLQDADLREVNLTGAYLAGANLRHADLRRAQLMDVNLAGADLRFADLRGADLTGARGVTREQLRLSWVDGTTRLPNK